MGMALHHAVARDRTSSWLSIGGYTRAVVVAVATCKCLAKNGVAVHMRCNNHRQHTRYRPTAAHRAGRTVRGSSSPWRACLPCRVARVGRTRSPKRRSRDVADPAAEDVTSRGFLSSLQLPVRSSPETKRRAVSRRRAHNRTRGYRSMARLGRQTADPIATTQHPRRSRRPRWARDDFAAFKNTRAATAPALPPPRAK